MELSSESAQRNSDVGTIHIGLGIIFVVLEAWPESGGGCASGYTWGQQV